MTRRGPPPSESQIPVGYAAILRACGESDRAIRVLEESLANLEVYLYEGSPRLAVTVGELTRCHLAASDTRTARRLAERAHATLEKTLGKDHPDLSPLLLTLADARMLDGDHRGAEGLYQKVLSISKRTRLETHLDFPLALSGTAIARTRDGRAAEAVEPMRDALHRMGRRARTLFDGATGNERLGLMVSMHWALANWLEVTRAAGVDGYAEVLRYKGYVGRTMALEQRLYRGATGKAREIYDELRKSRRRLARLAHSAPSGGWSTLAWRRRVAEAAEGCQDLEKALGRTYREYRAAQRRLSMAPARVRGGLRKGEALVDVLLAGGRYTAWVLAPGRPPTCVDLGEADEMDPLMQAFRAAVRQGSGGTARGVRRPDRPTLAADRCAKGTNLRKRLWEPVSATLPEGTTTVYLVPDGSLSATPIRALPGAAEGSVLDDEFLTVLLTSAQRLVPPEPRPRPGRGLVVIGGVDYFNTTRPQMPAVTGRDPISKRIPGGRNFAPLPATSSEAEFLKQIWKKAATGPVTLLDQERATENALRTSVPGVRLVHLATHGFVKRGLSTSLRLGMGEEFRLRAGLEVHAQRFDPLLVSGLALSGANVRVKENDDDGILTAYEALSLDLDGVQLVALSACETGRGIERAGEGVIGLVKGFTLAGARGVLASLWPVSDEGTLALMERFYEHLLRKGVDSPAAALLAAARDLRSGGRFADPRHWAAFVAYGPLR